MIGGLLRTATLLAAALAAAPGPVAGAQQIPVDTTSPAPPVTGGWGAVDVAPRPRTTVVSVTLAFPRGSAEDPDDASGTAWLLGLVVREMVLDRLAPGARASTEIAVDVERSRTLFRLVTLPRHWVEAYGALEWAVFGAAVPSGATEKARGELQAVFAFELDAPHREFELELYRLLAGVGSSWSRPPRGTRAGIEGIGPEELTAFRGRAYLKKEGAVSVVGAVDPERAARTVAGASGVPEGGAADPGFRPFDTRTGEPRAWDTGSRLEMRREVTSTWMAVAFPVDADTPRTALDMLVHHLERVLNPSPPDPGTFDVRVGVELLGTRELLVVKAAVVQEAAAQWERRILAAIGGIADDEMEPPYFGTYRRRFRAARLLTDAPPEAEGARRAVDLLRHGTVRDLAREISALDPDDLQEAADDLGEPRILVFGPDLSEGSSR